MANLDNFTNDEQLILTLSLSTAALIEKVSELTGIEKGSVSMQVCIAAGEYISNQSIDDLRQHLETERLENSKGRELARKHYQNYNN